MEATRETCIFCENPLDGSDEHIIPESVNGRLHSKQIICHQCNSKKFGRHIDPILSEMFKPLFQMLVLRNARSLQLEDPSGRKYVMEKSGKVSTVAPEHSIVKKDGLVYIAASGDPKNTFKKFAKLAAPYWNPKNEPKKFNVFPGHESNPPLSSEFKIEVTDKLILLFNKIILEFYAFSHLDLSIISELLKKVGALDYSLNNVCFINFKQEVREFGNEEISHLVTIRSQEKYLFGYVEIFNIICGLIVISDNYQGEEVEINYHQDALTGEVLTEPINLAPHVLKSTENYTPPSTDDFSLLTQALIERDRTRQFQEVFNKMLQEIKAKVEQEIQSGELPSSKFNEEFIKRSCEGIAYLTVYEFPYILDDAKDEQNEMYNYLHSNLREDQYETFIEDNKHAIGMRISFGEGEIYRLDSFIKTPVFKRGETKIIKIHCLLINEETGFKRYITFKDLSEGLIRENSEA